MLNSPTNWRTKMFYSQTTTKRISRESWDILDWQLMKRIFISFHFLFVWQRIKLKDIILDHNQAKIDMYLPQLFIENLDCVVWADLEMKRKLSFAVSELDEFIILYAESTRKVKFGETAASVAFFFLLNFDLDWWKSTIIWENKITDLLLTFQLSICASKPSHLSQ